jgi:DNA-binding transcriptional LysR family regulator
VIDVAIVDIPNTPFGELDVTPFWVETFSLFGRMDAPAVQPDRTMPVTLADIAELPLIAPSTRHAVRYLLEAAFERRSLKFRPVLEANGVLMMIELVRAGLGYTLMPASTFRAYNAFSELRSAEIERVIRRGVTRDGRAQIAKARRRDDVKASTHKIGDVGETLVITTARAMN